MGSSSKIVLGLILGGMMAIDMGGPFNKAAYVFGTAAIAAGNYDIMAAVMIGGMVPPCAIALSTLLFKNKFTKEEAELALLSFFEIEINQKLNYSLCITKFKEMLEKIRSKFTGDQYSDFIDYLIGFGAEPLTKFLQDQKYKNNFENFINSLQSYNLYINNLHKEKQQ